VTRYTGCNIHTRQTPNLLIQGVIRVRESKKVKWGGVASVCKGSQFALPVSNCPSKMTKTKMFDVERRHGGGRGESSASVHRKQRSADRHVDASWSSLRSDTEDGSVGPAWRHLEAARIRHLGSPSGPLLNPHGNYDKT